MTGFKSKKTAALDEDGMYLVHQTSYADNLGKSMVALGKQIVKDIERLKTQPAQWDTPSGAFNEWWNNDYDDSTNPFMVDTYAYWAFAGWQAALAQPAQEPVEIDLPEPIGYVSEGSAERLATNKQAHEQIRSFRLFTHDVPLYRHPQCTWVGLTDEQISDMWCEVSNTDFVTGDTHVFARAIEAKLKEKNA